MRRTLLHTCLLSAELQPHLQHEEERVDLIVEVREVWTRSGCEMRWGRRDTRVGGKLHDTRNAVAWGREEENM